MANEQADKRQYPLGRDFRASARLQLQHLMWNIRLGYLLHPSVPLASTPSIRIADIGTGNALWPIELSHHLPPTAQICGYDISSAQYPAGEWLPPNVQLDTLDMLGGELSEGLVGAFDVVHIRAFACVVKGGDPTAVTERLCRMLKPGGYLQWDEVDIGAYRAESPSAAIANSASAQLTQHFRSYVSNNRFTFGWTKNLPTVFSNANLEVLESCRLSPDSSLRKFETDNHLMALEDTLLDMARHLASRDDNTTFENAKDSLGGLLQGTVEEARRGVVLVMEWYSCLGRKKR